MDICFLGSIYGGSEKRADYKRLIERCKDYGNVLTEHVGSESAVEEAIGKKKISWVEHEQDIRNIKRCDAVIAGVTIPSTGVGYGIATAEHFGKKVLCVYDLAYDRPQSNVILGNRNLIVKGYFSIEEAVKILDSFMRETVGVVPIDEI